MESTLAVKALNWIKCDELIFQTDNYSKNISGTSFKLSNNSSLLYVPSEEVIQYALQHEAKESSESLDIKLSTIKDTDLIPAIYEGGFKIWECTYLLLKYFISLEFDFNNKVVLDLGCGCGLLGIYSALKNAKEVHFQDYNKSVLKYSTLQNVALNNVNNTVKYFCGDWSSFADDNLIEDKIYDCILSSETVYNIDNFDKLFKIFTKKLKSDGSIYLIAKSYYFGVGGGISQFQKYLTDKAIFEFHTVWKNLKGVRCELLHISFKH